VIALLDTNAYTALMRGEESILDALTQAHQILMSCVVVGELEYGFCHGLRYDDNRARLEEWLAEPYVDFLTLTRDTTIRYGAISADLRGTGQKIPTNDAWIAAHATEHRATVWTRDRHFDRIAGVQVRGW